ncbi:Aconitase/isopropylmalate dehydratase protein [Raphanus sativus]|nr:Aconitase/isopropylmalate dehydratase protein [Raphanus sativus]
MMAMKTWMSFLIEHFSTSVFLHTKHQNHGGFFSAIPKTYITPNPIFSNTSPSLPISLPQIQLPSHSQTPRLPPPPSPPAPPPSRRREKPSTASATSSATTSTRTRSIPAEYLTLVPSNPDEYEKLGSYALIGLPASYQDGSSSRGDEDEVLDHPAGRTSGAGRLGSTRRCAWGRGGEGGGAQSYARIFFRNSVATGEVYPLDSEEYKLKPIGDAGPVIDAGGIFAYARKAGMIPSAAAPAP